MGGYICRVFPKKLQKNAGLLGSGPPTFFYQCEPGGVYDDMYMYVYVT